MPSLPQGVLPPVHDTMKKTMSTDRMITITHATMLGFLLIVSDLLLDGKNKYIKYII